MNAIVKELEQALQETTLGEWLPVKAGDCELCGRWDTALIQGVGICCRAVGEPRSSVVPLSRARCALPCNEHMFSMLARLQAAVLLLDELHAIVARIELSSGEPTIHLQQPLPVGAAGGVYELVRTVEGAREKYCRARFAGCTLEWRVL